MNDELSVGEVARRCGVSPDLIRYYERKGVIPAARRASNRYRRHEAATVERVQIVRRAVALGFTVDEIARLFRKRATGKPPCREVCALAERKLADLDERIREMSALREHLAATIVDWDVRLERAAGEAAYLLETVPR